MKKVLSFIIGFLMICALMVGSGDPAPGTPLKTIVTTELVCLAMLTIGRCGYGKPIVIIDNRKNTPPMNNLNFTTITVIDSSGKKNILENIGDPNSVEWVCIENTRYGFSFLLNKNALKEKLNHSASVERAKEIHPAGRLGDRFEWISVYNAIHTAGLNDILERIGGDIIGYAWYWTEEQDEFASDACYAWLFHGSYGYLGNNGYRVYAGYARVFRAF